MSAFFKDRFDLGRTKITRDSNTGTFLHMKDDMPSTRGNAHNIRCL